MKQQPVARSHKKKTIPTKARLIEVQKPQKQQTSKERSAAQENGLPLTADLLKFKDMDMLNAVNTALLRISDTGWALSAAHVTFIDKVASGGSGFITFSIANEKDKGELPFKGLDDCLAKLLIIKGWAKLGRRTS